MGRSKAKSKIGRRLRAAKRALIDNEVTTKKKQQLYEKILLSSKGFKYRESYKPNAFLHPEDPIAKFPQFVPNKPLDFRSNKNPYSGFEQRGNKRKEKAAHEVEVRLAGEINPEILKMEKEMKKSNEIDINNTEDALINTMINMKIIDKKYGLNKKKRIGKRWSKRNLKKTKRATRF